MHKGALTYFIALFNEEDLTEGFKGPLCRRGAKWTLLQNFAHMWRGVFLYYMTCGIRGSLKACNLKKIRIGEHSTL